MNVKQITLDITYFDFENFKNPEDVFEKINNRVDFLSQDIMGFLQISGKSCRLINIINHEGSKEDVTEMIKDVIDKYDDGNTIIFTTAYLSTVEFPEKEYYLDNQILNKEKKKGKKAIPIDEVLKRESILLSSLGFIDVNFYTAYEFKIAFIYGNTIGKEIFNYWKNIEEEKGDE